MIMEGKKTKSLKSIEEKMQGLDPESLRYHVLDCAKNFKNSWVELGRSLYSVWKDKMYKDWGYSNFDIYTAKEIGIRKSTAMKLLRSYYFLEKEEPEYLKKEQTQPSEAAKIPTYESIDLLRRAKTRKILDGQDYANFKKDIFEKGKDFSQARRDLTALIRQREELEPEEAYKKRRLATIKRFLGTLKAIKQEAEVSKLLPAPLIREAQELIKKIEEQISS
jgi:hypothetical protein